MHCGAPARQVCVHLRDDTCSWCRGSWYRDSWYRDSWYNGSWCSVPLSITAAAPDLRPEDVSEGAWQRVEVAAGQVGGSDP